jgi:hypothetical protein
MKNFFGTLARGFGLIGFLIIVSSCGGTMPTPTPTTTTRLLITPVWETAPAELFQGILLTIEDGDLYEIVVPASGLVEHNLLAAAVYNAAMAPDHQHVLYSLRGSGDTVLYDLQARSSIRTLPAAGDCVSWSPDGKYYLTGGFAGRLDLSDLTENTIRIYDAPTAVYQMSGRHYGSFTCPAWLDASHLIFDRYAGQMPGSFSDFSDFQPNQRSILNIGRELGLLARGITDPYSIEAPPPSADSTPGATVTPDPLAQEPRMSDYSLSSYNLLTVCPTSAWYLLRDPGSLKSKVAPFTTAWDQLEANPFAPCDTCDTGLTFNPASCEVNYAIEYTPFDPNANGLRARFMAADPVTLATRQLGEIKATDLCTAYPDVQEASVDSQGWIAMGTTSRVVFLERCTLANEWHLFLSVADPLNGRIARLVEITPTDRFDPRVHVVLWPSFVGD